MCSNHELQATLNALGYLEDGEYYKSRDCLNATKDLVRYLRRDDPNEKTVRLELLKSDVISNDLIPLIKVLKPKKDAELFDLVLRLLVNLTQSALNCFELKIPEDKLKYNVFLEIDNHLVKTKEPFANEAFIKIITDKLKEITSKSWEDRPEEEDMMVERILYLFRNVLQIKLSDDDVENRLETDLNTHDLLLLSFHKANLFETIIDMTSSHEQAKYYIHLLEIISLILKDQSPEELAKVSENEVNLKSKRSFVEKERDNDELAKLTMRDQQQKKHNRMRLNPRHSRFMGTYVAMNMKSINDENNLIVHKKASTMDDLLDDASKKQVRKAKNKVVFEKEEQQHRSVLFIRIILKKFCLTFMQKSYNNFFRALKDQIQRKKLEDDEMCYYYSLIQFLTEFNRNTDQEEQAKLEQIKETFSTELFHSVEVFIQRCTEMMRVDKKQCRLWAKRMHTSLKCYKENLVNLFALEKKISLFNAANNSNNQTAATSQESDLVELAENLIEGSTPINQQPRSLLDERTTALLNKLKGQIFNIQEFRELFLTLLKDFDQSKMTKGFLRDIIEANHIFILLLEYHMKKNGSLSVLSKKRKKKPRKKSAPKKKETKEQKEKRLAREKEHKKRLDNQEPEFKEKIWQKSFAKIASLIQNETELNVQTDQLMPFDFVATSDQEFDSQKDLVIEKIQNFLVENKPDDSLALFREARCLWPNDKDLFGAAQVQADEEFEIFKNLFMKQLEIKEPVVEEEEEEKEDKPEQPEQDEGIEDDDPLNEENKESNEYEDEENDDDENKYILEEEKLELDKFIFRYTHPHILKCYILMLSEYAKNSDFLNRCCMSMFEKIAYDCHALQCLYQLSLFNLINTMHKDPMSRCCMNILENNTQKKSIDDLYASNYSCEDMFAFFRQLVGKFFEQTEKNNKLFLEILFFKEKKMIYCLSEEGGYEPMFAENSNGRKRKIAWTQEEQDELKELFERFQPKFDENYDENDKPVEGDLIDQIMLHIQDGSRKRRDICNQLVNIGCVKSIDDFKQSKFTNGNKKLGRNNLWRPEDVDDLKQCFELVLSESKQTDSPLGQMMHKLQEILSIKRNKKQIAEKLVELDLIKDKSEIISKKPKSNKLKRDDFINNSDYDENDDENSKKKKDKKKSKKDKKKKSQKESQDNGNDLFDAESGSESESDDSDNDDESSESSEASSSSDSEEENQKQAKKDKIQSSKKLTLSDDDNEKTGGAKQPTKSDDEASRDSNKSDKNNKRKKSNKSKDKLSSKSQDEVSKESKKDKFKKLLLSDEDDDESVKPKEPTQPEDESSRDSTKSTDTSKENRASETKKRKKSTKFRIVEDESSNDALTGEKKALNEIGNSDVNEPPSNVKKMNYNEVFNKILNSNDNESSDESSDDDGDDDDLPLSALASKPKRQKLVLSDDDE